MAIREHQRNNLVLARYAAQAYRESHPYFIAAHIIGAMPMGEILRNRFLLAWNTGVFGIFLALDTVLIPRTRGIAARSVRQIMRLMSTPADVVPIRPTAY
jgi:hypothetical protein